MVPGLKSIKIHLLPKPAQGFPFWGFGLHNHDETEEFLWLRK
jgi:hypothetical protein